MTINDSNVDLASYIDHALLHPAITEEEIKHGCTIASRYNFPTVCVYPSAVRLATELLHNQKTKVCTVIGFPTGATTTATKLQEAEEAREFGAEELDVVINLGWLKAGKSEPIYHEIAAICNETGKTVKAIIETGLLTNTEKRLATEIVMDAGVAFVKTNTGWFGGATVEDVRLLHKITKGQIGIKASGGIKTIEQAISLIEAGATRLGTSHGPELIRQRDNLSARKGENE
jgi:deoxyribose-phosphate aldolase